MDSVAEIVLAVVVGIPPFNQENLSREALLDAPLAGKGSTIDSITLVKSHFSIEERIQDEMGVPIEITAEKALSQTRSPFRTPRTLIDYISNDLLASVRPS